MSREGKEVNHEGKGYRNMKEDLKFFTSWGYTKEAFDYWAHKFRKKLDEIHGQQATQ